MSDIARGWGAALLIALSLWISATNAWCMFRPLWGQRARTWVPLVGGVFGCIAYWVAPTSRLHAWCWLPFVYDVGCLFGMGSTAYYYLCDSLRHSPRDRC